MAGYVVAGVTGRVGSVVARELLAGGHRVTVIVRDAARGADWARRGAEVAVGSLFQDNIASLMGAAMHQGIYPNLLPSADAAFPMIATTDVGHFAARALTAPPEAAIVDLFGPVYSVRQLAEKLGATIGRTLDILTVPPAGHVAALTQSGLPQEFAEAVAEMLAGFSSGKIVPQGDRSLTGTTTVDDVLRGLVAHA